MLVSRIPTLPSPNQEAIQSIALRPGRLKIGRMILLSSVPNSSNRPKLSRRGSSKPAKINTENSVGSRPSRTRPPVFSSQITSGPTWKKAITAAAPPIKRTNNHSGDGLKRPFKNEFDVMNVGLKMVLKTEATDMKATIAVMIGTRYSPKTA
ncbi:hypothetical protein VCR17J2_90038 [Vibrio coralliirubri]|nr:hypothetical protein VCR17J2_90038 [Vibrio coralliirubri]